MNKLKIILQEVTPEQVLQIYPHDKVIKVGVYTVLTRDNRRIVRIIDHSNNISACPTCKVCKSWFRLEKNNVVMRCSGCRRVVGLNI